MAGGPSRCSCLLSASGRCRRKWHFIGTCSGAGICQGMKGRILVHRHCPAYPPADSPDFSRSLTAGAGPADSQKNVPGQGDSRKQHRDRDSDPAPAATGSACDSRSAPLTARRFQPAARPCPEKTLVPVPVHPDMPQDKDRKQQTGDDMRHSPVVPYAVTVPMPGDMKPETCKHRCGEKRHKHP